MANKNGTKFGVDLAKWFEILGAHLAKSQTSRAAFRALPPAEREAFELACAIDNGLAEPEEKGTRKVSDTFRTQSVRYPGAEALAKLSKEDLIGLLAPLAGRMVEIASANVGKHTPKGDVLASHDQEMTFAYAKEFPTHAKLGLAPKFGTVKR